MDNQTFNPPHWAIRERFTLWEASLLWVEHDPLEKPDEAIARRAELVAAELEAAIFARRLKADAIVNSQEFEDELGVVRTGVSIDRKKTTLERNELAAWAIARGITPWFLSSTIALKSGVKSNGTRDKALDSVADPELPEEGAPQPSLPSKDVQPVILPLPSRWALADPEQTYLTAAEAAAFLGIKVGTLNVWRSNKRYGLRYTKSGSRVKYKLADLKQFLESRTVVSDQTVDLASPKPVSKQRTRRS
jgi:excisionase family DNA binding protein